MKTLARAVLLLVLVVSAPLAAAEEKKVSFAFDGATLAEAARFLEVLKGVKVEVADELADRVFTLKVSDLEIGAALELVAKLVDAEARVERVAQDHYRILTDDEQLDRDAAVGKALGTTTVNFDFAETPLAEVVRFLGMFANVNVIVLPEVYETLSERERLVTLRAENITVQRAFDLITRPMGLAFEIQDGVVQVGVAKPRDWREEIGERLGKKVTFNFADTDLTEALGFLSQYAGVNIVVDPAVSEAKSREQLLVTLNATVTVENAVDLITSIKGLGFDLRWGAVFVSTRERLANLPANVPEFEPKPDDPKRARLLAALEAPTTFHFDQAGLTQVLDFLRTVHGVNIVVDDVLLGETEGIEVSMRVSNLPLLHALSLVLLPRNLPFRIHEGLIFVSRNAPSPPRKPAAEFAGVGPVSLDFDETPLAEVVADLSERTGVTILLDPHLEKVKIADELLVSVRVRDLSLGSSLDLITLTQGLAWDRRWGLVFISTRDRLAALPDTEEVLGEPARGAEEWETGLRAELAEKVTFALAAASITQVVEFISTLRKVNLVIAPDARAAAEVVTVTITVENISVADALAAILLPRGFGFTLRNEVVLIEKR